MVVAEQARRLAVKQMLSRISPLFLPAGAFVLALSVNLLHIALADWGASLISPFAHSDAYYYLHRAWYAAFVNPNGGELVRAIPLSPYAWTQAWAYRALGPYAWVPFVTNTLLVSAACAFIALTTRRIFDERTAWVAAAILALSGPVVFFAGITVKTNIELILLGAGLYATSSYFANRNSLVLGGAALLLGFLTIPRNNMLVLIALLCFMALVGRVRERAWKGLAWDAVVLLAALAAFASVTSWNVASLEQPHFSPVGVNFYVGNSPGATGTYTDIAGIRNDLIGHHSDTIAIAESRVGRHLSPSEVSSYWLMESFRYIREQPGEFIVLQVRKLGMLLAQTAHGLPEQYALWRWEKPALWVAFLDFGAVLALSVVGIASHRQGNRQWREQPMLVFLVAGTLLYAATVWAFFIGERYRVPLMIMLAPIAAFAVTSIVDERQRTTRSKRLGSVIGIYLVSVLLTGLNASGPGWAGKPEEARRNEFVLQRMELRSYGIRQDAVLHNNAKAWSEVSTDFFRRRLYQDAEEVAEKAIGLAPGDPEPYRNLARQLMRRGSIGKVKELLDRVKNESAKAGAQQNRMIALQAELSAWLAQSAQH